MLALLRGPLQIASTEAVGACAWVGAAGSVSPMEWPKGWTALFTPVPELLNSDGVVIAHAGDTLAVGGGLAPALTSGCGVRAGTPVWMVEGTVDRLGGSG